MNYTEIDNFLSKKDHRKIVDYFTTPLMPWYYNKNQTQTPKNLKQDSSHFTHRFYYNDMIETNSEIFDLIRPILEKLNPDKLLRVKANLIINRGTHDSCNFHIDSHEPNLLVAVYYINTNNGYTLLDPSRKIKVKCKANKLLKFDGKISHAVVSQTDQDQRIVLNINYIKNNESFS